MIAKSAKTATIKKFATKKDDTGSSPVQIALLTQRINALSEHLQAHKKDIHSRRGLLCMVSQRRKHLDYLKKQSNQKYLDLIKELNIRK
jgi:small subunit ribosomal protein S15